MIEPTLLPILVPVVQTILLLPLLLLLLLSFLPIDSKRAAFESGSSYPGATSRGYGAAGGATVNPDWSQSSYKHYERGHPSYTSRMSE